MKKYVIAVMLLLLFSGIGRATNEISVGPGLTTGLTVYAIIQNSVQSGASTYWIPGSTAFATPSTWVSMAVSLTGQSVTGSYFANMPTGITTVGDYYVTVYEQAGGSPALGDLQIGSGYIYWMGTYAIGQTTIGTNLATANTNINSANTSLGTISTNVSSANTSLGTISTNVNATNTSLGTISTNTANVPTIATRVLLALPAVAAGASGGLPFGDSSGNVKLSSTDTQVASELTSQGYTTTLASNLGTTNTDIPFIYSQTSAPNQQSNVGTEMVTLGYTSSLSSALGGISTTLGNTYTLVNALPSSSAITTAVWANTNRTITGTVNIASTQSFNNTGQTTSIPVTISTVPGWYTTPPTVSQIAAAVTAGTITPGNPITHF